MLFKIFIQVEVNTLQTFKKNNNLGKFYELLLICYLSLTLRMKASKDFEKQTVISH